LKEGGDERGYEDSDVLLKTRVNSWWSTPPQTQPARGFLTTLDTLKVSEYFPAIMEKGNLWRRNM
jgi:hypothetical protein